ncbi:hypothetical protein THAOC_16991 [Thalassiosira oceanica]|uniref:Uncharacterized protein n=1 Tax=Thalassiosira oceanica TaxID=159749 RepID=K0SAT4_THAOC|nr:hypothetical protein THAOC_16991 [Thalassiosira oceanica]|eukprot:EJK62400.1 hypothetical protein THAOC_16991 [Thalassiosira oceanica]
MAFPIGTSFANLVSNSGSHARLNSRRALMSSMQRHLQAHTTKQADIIVTVAKEPALVVISRASGEPVKSAILHHISTEGHAEKGGAVSAPTVFSCYGLHEAKVAHFSKAEEDEGPIEEVSSAAFMVVNGRVLVLEELEKHIDSSFDSLLKALVDLTSQDLIADFEESNPGESLPSVPDLARIKIRNEEDVPFRQQILHGHEERARDSWKQALESLPRPPVRNDMDDGPGLVKSPPEDEALGASRKRKAEAPPTKFPVGTSVLAIVDSQAIKGTISAIHPDEEDLALPSYSIDIKLGVEETTIEGIAEEAIRQVTNVRGAAAKQSQGEGDRQTARKESPTKGSPNKSRPRKSAADKFGAPATNTGDQRGVHFRDDTAAKPTRDFDNPYKAGGGSTARRGERPRPPNGAQSNDLSTAMGLMNATFACSGETP